MISICIPIYNIIVTDLVKSLSTQAKSLNFATEIILIDDCSDDSIKLLNEDTCSKYNYIKLKKNIGRSAIRNQFLQYAQYDFLLFLDCDALIINDDFIEKYFHSLTNSSVQIICAGRVYPTQPPIRNERLRWKYGSRKESLTVEERRKRPNKSFMTNNFLINKEVFRLIKFDERLKGYGHEDTLFGFELKKRGITITHIDNPILNGDLEKTKDYLFNSEKAIINLIRVLEFKKFDEDFVEDITLAKTYFNLHYARSLQRGFFKLINPLTKWILLNGISNLGLFNLFKFGVFTLEMDKRGHS